MDDVEPDEEDVEGVLDFSEVDDVFSDDVDVDSPLFDSDAPAVLPAFERLSVR